MERSRGKSCDACERIHMCWVLQLCWQAHLWCLAPQRQSSLASEKAAKEWPPQKPSESSYVYVPVHAKMPAFRCKSHVNNSCTASAGRCVLTPIRQYTSQTAFPTKQNTIQSASSYLANPCHYEWCPATRCVNWRQLANKSY